MRLYKLLNKKNSKKNDKKKVTNEYFKKLFLTKCLYCEHAPFGWRGGDVSFHELTIKEAKEKKLDYEYYAIIDKKEQFFVMNETGHVYDLRCNIVFFNSEARHK